MERTQYFVLMGGLAILLGLWWCKTHHKEKFSDWTSMFPGLEANTVIFDGEASEWLNSQYSQLYGDKYQDPAKVTTTTLKPVPQ